MYIKKSRLIVGAIAIVIITAVLTVCVVNPFGFTQAAEFFKFAASTKMIRSNYYEDIDAGEAANMATAGVAASTGDPYTNYLWGDMATKYMEEVEGNYCGVGLYIECDTDENLISVVSAIAGSPAEAEGITTGDKILKIDDKQYAGTELSEAASYMRGEEGTDVTLTVRNASDRKEREVTLKRSRIEIESVSSKMLDGKIGYISMTQFIENVTEKFAEQSAALEQQGMRALIVDLRNNPGGLLDEAIGVASLFVPMGETITYTLDKHNNKEMFKSVAVDGKEKKISVPVVILVNGGSASASEVLTGALSDHGIATVIGEKSYGKGIVQSVFNVGDDSLISVTVARYFPPDGICIHGEGIEPDVKVEMDAEKAARLSTLPLSEDTQLLAAIDYLNK